MLSLLFKNIFNKDIALASFSFFISYIKVNFVAAKPENKKIKKMEYISRKVNYIIAFV